MLHGIFTYLSLLLSPPHHHPCCRVKDIVVFHEAGLTSNLSQSNPIAKLFEQMMRSFTEQVSAALVLSAFTCSVQYSGTSL